MHRQIYRTCLENVKSMIEKTKRQFYLAKIEASEQKSIFKLASTLLNKSTEIPLPLHDSAKELATHFNNFFVEKIINIREDLESVAFNLKPLPPLLQTAPEFISANTPCLMNFSPTTEDEVKKIILDTKTTQCLLDPIPTKLLKECIHALLPMITKIVNLSLSQGIMPPCLKKAVVVPLLKKPSLNQEVLKHFRPVSNLPYLSKVIERVVAKRIRDHMDINNLHELLQSSYKKFQSCETALLKVKDDILRAIDDKKCVILVL